MQTFLSKRDIIWEPLIICTWNTFWHFTYYFRLCSPTYPRKVREPLVKAAEEGGKSFKLPLNQIMCIIHSKCIRKFAQCLHRRRQSSVHHYSSQVVQRINSNYHAWYFLMMPLWFYLQLCMKALQNAASVSPSQMIMTSLVTCSEGCFWKELAKG